MMTVVEAQELVAVSWQEVADAVDALVGLLASHLGQGRPAWESVHGVPRGGCVPAAMVAARMGLPLVGHVGPRTLVVDDLVDSGRTAERFSGQLHALWRKSWSPPSVPAVFDAPRDAWLVFPWEVDESGPLDAVVRLLSFLGEDPNRDGLVDTPARVVKALGEMTEGYGVDPAAVLGTTFDVSYDQMVVVRDVPFTSLCEHHMLPFVGTATVAYVPTDRVVGLSKLARLVQCFAHRLQIQERMTAQIATAIEDHLRPAGTGVVVSARHSCMASRGVRLDAAMVTSALHGALRDDPRARAEFMALAGY